MNNRELVAATPSSSQSRSQGADGHRHWERDAASEPNQASRGSSTPPLLLEHRVDLLQKQISTLTGGQVGANILFTWTNIPDFDPNRHNIQINKWIRLVDEKAYFSRWDDVTTFGYVVSKLVGRAREWYLSSDNFFGKWSVLKSALKETFDIDSSMTGRIFEEAANFTSFNEKLTDYLLYIKIK